MFLLLSFSSFSFGERGSESEEGEEEIRGDADAAIFCCSCLEEGKLPIVFRRGDFFINQHCIPHQLPRCLSFLLSFPCLQVKGGCVGSSREEFGG